LSALACLPLVLDEGRLEELLQMWARWMSSHQPLRDLWYPDGACGCVGGGNSQTFEDMVESAEIRTVEGVNGAIESLTPIEQCAITHMHLYAVYRFREPLEVVYERAKGTLRVGLPMRGIY
jgi:hypothetical protein